MRGGLPGCTMSLVNTSVSRSFHNPCRELWDLVTDTTTWPRWGPSVQAVECAERFITQGTRGRIRTVGGIWLSFLITGYEEGRFWSWRVAGIPATGHRIRPREDGSCTLTFEVPLLAAPYAFVCKIALDRIAVMLDRLTPGPDTPRGRGMSRSSVADGSGR